ncbi:SGNH/GDSL hydrolase family protein [Ottowia sp.]|uniref:SGNH/GDSL hydrolase family protein n=1 Tax=Ottowia sp. TaxID=1898956 RepID=UPI002BE731A4|nr:SGNH/GDSL hydrolase family protein [Ottowia sp.]HPZ55688.1 SGNH/GDSL hydrolase family protein [Ottowia sp.]HQD48832.1 SGNH/GDSL hydrolase family protein [Ottowia sp.]
MHIKTHLNWKLSALALAAALTACGGDDSNPLGLNAVKVVGDSLNDSGTFAGLPGGPRIASVQGSADEPNVLWVERVAKAYDVNPLCAVYKFSGTDFPRNSVAGCTNYAVAGARINNPASAGGAKSPYSIGRQLQDAADKGWGAKDLLLVDGGGNDAADLVTAYLGAAVDKGAAYSALLATLVPAATLQTVLAGPNGAATAGGVYMQALADNLTGTVKTLVLDKGAKYVLVSNIPPVTYTPRFQNVLDQIAAASGGGTAGATARAQAEGLFKAWVDAFNQRLAANFAGESRVKVFDLAAQFTDQMANPAKYGLTNVTLPVCGAGWVTVVPTRSLADCTASALAATTPPPGAPAGTGWWQRYLFSDGFHPTPYGHQLFGDGVIKLLESNGWL